MHFCSFLGMVFLVSMEGLFGTSLTKPARVSLMLGATQVSLGLLVNSLFVRRILEDFRSIPYWIWFLLREYEFHFQSARFLWISQRTSCLQICKLMESQLALHIRQEFSQ